MLTYCIPQIDVNPIAHRLEKRFGSFAGVLDATVSELCEVEGISTRAAIFLKMFTDIGRKYQLSKMGDKISLSSPEKLGEYCVALMHGRIYETLYLLCLDTKRRLINTVFVMEGTVVEMPIQVRKLVEIAMTSKAAAVVLVHNHPGGLPYPSEQDIQTTQIIVDALRNIQVSILDHIIVADSNWCSMQKEGLFKNIKQW